MSSLGWAGIATLIAALATVVAHYLAGIDLSSISSAVN